MSKKSARLTLIDHLKEDLSREYQAIIAYITYSQVIKGATLMHIAKELEKHAQEELRHAITIAKMVDYLGGKPSVTVNPPVKTSDKAEDMLRFDLDNVSETVRNYRERFSPSQVLPVHFRCICVQALTENAAFWARLGQGRT